MSYKKNAIVFITALSVISLVILFYFVRHKKVRKVDEIIYAANEHLSGIYRGDFSQDKIGNIKLIYIKWNNKDTVESNFRKVISNNTNLILTIGIWPEHNENVLTSILLGEYDKKISDLANIIGQRNDVMIRFLPDMEVPVQLFSWQYQSPDTYIKAFNYFATHLKHSSPNIKIIWSPAGYPGDSEYWPGASTVDAIAISLDGKSEKLSTAFPVNNHGVLDVLENKIHRMRFMDKPIFILSSDSAPNKQKMLALLKKVEVHVDSFKNTIYSTSYFMNSVNVTVKRNKLNIGIYDPRENLVKSKNINTEHLFTNWGEIQRGEFITKFNQVVNRHHDIIVTMEPWRDINGKDDPSTLQNTVLGKYDHELASLYKTISISKQHVYLRWAHEMELPIHRYPWQSQSTVDYINSFRYVMNFRKKSSNISRIWGPAGDRGSADWYPGDDVVDFISVAIYGLPDKNITDQNMQESFGTIYQRKKYRMRFFHKPIFITEFGVKGDENYKKKWLYEASKAISRDKNIFGVCYFNLHDNPKAWGKIEAPDWSLKEKTFDSFCDTLH